MQEQKNLCFNEKERILIDLLIEAGIRKNFAMTLVYLANRPEATPRKIEHGIDLRQRGVRIAITGLAGQGWIICREAPLEKKGHPQKYYSLSMPLNDIITSIENEEKKKVAQKRALFRKIRDYL